MKDENQAMELVNIFLGLLVILTISALVWSILQGPIYFVFMLLLFGGFWVLLLFFTGPNKGWHKLKPIAFFVVWVGICFYLPSKFDMDAMNKYLLGYRNCTVFVTNPEGECTDIQYGILKVKGQHLYWADGGHKEYPENYTINIAKQG